METKTRTAGWFSKGIGNAVAEINGIPKDLKLVNIKTEDIRVIDQVRTTFDEEALAELRNSIQKTGLQEPLVVLPKDSEGKYLLQNGERRFRAIKALNWEVVPCLINSRKMTEAERRATQIVDNLVREDLTPMDLAKGVARLKSEFNMSQAEIAEQFGKTKAWVSTVDRLNGISKNTEKLLPLTKDIYALAGVIRLEEKYPQQVAEFCERAVTEGFSLLSARALKKRLENPESEPVAMPTPAPAAEQPIKPTQPANPTVKPSGNKGITGATVAPIGYPEFDEENEDPEPNDVLIGIGGEGVDDNFFDDGLEPAVRTPQVTISSVSPQPTPQAIRHRITKIMGFNKSTNALHVTLENGDEAYVRAEQLLVDLEL